MQEVWKPVKDYEGFYEISNFGRIRSLPRNGTIKDIKILSLSNDKDGYKIITLQKNGKPRTKKVHRLVAEVFLENREGKKQVNHIDGNKSNNLVNNLEWCSCKENNIHRCKVLGFRGTPHHCKKVRCIETGEVYESMSSAAKAKGGHKCNLKNAILKNGQQRFADCHWEFV